jgi:transcriptional regulator with XRE-family HTH domain/tetratricopeptide (TPR) repeat protein
VTESFGAQLRRYRLAAGLTQEALAERARLSTQAIGALERGDRRFPYRATVDRLSAALDLTDEQQQAFAAVTSRRGTPGASRPEPGAKDPPRQLPGQLAVFAGRDAEVDRLLRLFEEPETAVVAAISGMAGVGKTSLAVHIGHLLAPRFPGGQLYLDLRGHAARPTAPIDALDALLRAFGDTEPGTLATLQAASAHFRSLLAGKRVLLILDNAPDVEHVAPLLPGTAGSAAIVTSRAVLPTLAQAHQVFVDVLPERAAVELLAATAGPDRVAAEPDAAAAVVRLCGRLPLAIHLAGARLATRPGRPVAHLAERLADEHRCLDELEATPTGVRASFAWSFDQLALGTHPLDRQAARVYPLLSLLDVPDLPTSVVCRLLDLPEQQTERLLERLADLHLLEAPAPGRYRLHDLLRRYAGELATAITVPDRAAALTRVLELYATVAWRSMALVSASSHRLDWAAGRAEATAAPALDTPAEAFGWLDTHHPPLVTAVEQAIGIPGVPGDVVASVGLGLFAYYRARARWRDAIRVNEAALTLVSAGSDRAAVATLRNDLGIAAAELTRASGSDDYRRAHDELRQSLADCSRLDDRRYLAACLNNLCFVFGLGNHLDEAVDFGERSLALNRELGMSQAETMTLVNLGVLYGRKGDPQREFAYATEALDVARRTGDDRGMAYAQSRIGVVHQEAGRYEPAVTNLRQSARLWRAAGVRLDEGIALAALGRTLLDMGELCAAAKVLADAHTLLHQHGGAERETAVLADLELARNAAKCAGEL